MEATFLESWDNACTRTPITLHLISWNIQGTKNKLTNPHVYKFLNTFDIICLNEIKTALPISLTGYITYRSTQDQDAHRGGCAILLKHFLRDQVTRVRTPSQDCIWLNLNSLPGITIIACYIPPSDSHYHSFSALAEMQEEIRRFPDQQFIIIGDMNARFGESRSNFLLGKTLPQGTHYEPSPDPISNLNSNARHATSALAPLILLNNLSLPEKTFHSALTFRKRLQWISELDVCFTTEKTLQFISHFTVHQSTNLPSDHAPISIVIVPQKSEDLVDHERTLARATSLGSHDNKVTTNCCKKTIRMSDIDSTRAKASLIAAPPPTFDAGSIEELVAAMNHTLYTCSQNSKKETEPAREAAATDQGQGERWRRLLEESDARTLWKAINWNGSVDESRSPVQPNDDEFQKHFERLLNPVQTNDNNATPASWRHICPTHR